MYKGYEYSQDGRYGNGSYRGFTLYPDIDEDGEIIGYFIGKDQETLKTVGNLREGLDWINDQLEYPDYCKDCETHENVKFYRLKNIVQKGKYQGNYGKTIALHLCQSCLKNYLNLGWMIVE